MALSKTAIKKIKKHKRQYYVIVPLSRDLYDSADAYFNHNRNKYVCDCSPEYCLYIFDELEYEDIKIYIKNDDVFKTIDKYNNKQEVYNDVKIRNIKIFNSKVPKGVEKVSK